MRANLFYGQSNYFDETSIQKTVKDYANFSRESGRKNKFAIPQAWRGVEHEIEPNSVSFLAETRHAQGSPRSASHELVAKV
jgi:hypothetical protein